ncbi:cell division protein MraZ [Streptococcus salivarius]|uniref:cell division protein MraZ n=1 Tax=Streptococcus salivarius TaxID=1304 RepID=UPI0015832FE7|nr:cell division protein MraZ [Streptococcus salivarius]
MTGFWEDLRERIIANQQAKLDDAAYNERLDNIGKATTALLEAGIDEERTKTLLQKHWDLRPSEAQEFIDFVYKYVLKTKKEK